MEIFLNFIVKNYLWFLIITICLLLSLIGYFVELKRSKTNPYKIEKNNEINLEDLTKEKEDISLQSAINKTNNNGETLDTL